MSDVTKLKKQVQKSMQHVHEKSQALDAARVSYGTAERELGMLVEKLEAAEALEAVQELRGGKSK